MKTVQKKIIPLTINYELYNSLLSFVKAGERETSTYITLKSQFDWLTKLSDALTEFKKDCQNAPIEDGRVYLVKEIESIQEIKQNYSKEFLKDICEFVNNGYFLYTPSNKKESNYLKSGYFVGLSTRKDSQNANVFQINGAHLYNEDVLLYDVINISKQNTVAIIDPYGDNSKNTFYNTAIKGVIDIDNQKIIKNPNYQEKIGEFCDYGSRKNVFVKKESDNFNWTTPNDKELLMCEIDEIIEERDDFTDEVFTKSHIFLTNLTASNRQYCADRNDTLNKVDEIIDRCDLICNCINEYCDGFDNNDKEKK